MRPDPAEPLLLKRRATRLWNTTGMRLAVLGAGLAAFSATVVFVIIYLGAVGAMRMTLDTNINNEISEIIPQGANTPLPAIAAKIHAAIAETPTTVFYSLIDVHGQRIAGNLKAPMPNPGWHTIDAPSDRSFAPNVQTLRIRVWALPRGRLLVGVDATILAQLNNLIRRSFLIGFGITSMIGLVAGIGFGWRALARVEAVSATGREIMEGDFSRRIPLSGSGDEFDHLAASINAMLARIELLMSNIRSVGNEIAHDLRSPLARLRGTLELALRDPAQMPDAIAEAILQVDATLRLSAAILRLAQVESGVRRAHFAPVDVSKLIEDLVETFETVIEDQGGTLRTNISEGLMMNGDAALLNQMLVNLIENAMTHGSGDVTITATADADTIVLMIADQGPGISPDRQVEALRRFGRLDPSRSTDGNGLGLPLASAITVLHDGTLALAESRQDSKRPGLAVTMTFPTINGSMALRQPRCSKRVVWGSRS